MAPTPKHHPSPTSRAGPVSDAFIEACARRQVEVSCRGRGNQGHAYRFLTAREWGGWCMGMPGGGATAECWVAVRPARWWQRHPCLLAA